MSDGQSGDGVAGIPDSVLRNAGRRAPEFQAVRRRAAGRVAAVLAATLTLRPAAGFAAASLRLPCLVASTDAFRAAIRSMTRASRTGVGAVTWRPLSFWSTTCSKAAL